MGYQGKIDAIRSFVRHGENNDQDDDYSHYAPSQRLEKNPEICMLTGRVAMAVDIHAKAKRQ